jgi:hypothetical protein
MSNNRAKGGEGQADMGAREGHSGRGIKATDIARRKLQARGTRAFAEWIGASKQQPSRPRTIPLGPR